MQVTPTRRRVGAAGLDEDSHAAENLVREIETSFHDEDPSPNEDGTPATVAMAEDEEEANMRVVELDETAQGHYRRNIFQRMFHERGVLSLVAAYLIFLHATPLRLASIHNVAMIIFYAIPAIFVLPVALGAILTFIMYQFVIFDRQLDIGAIHLQPWIADKKLNILVRSEGLRFGFPRGFNVPFLEVKNFSVWVTLSWRDVLNLGKIGMVWNPAGLAEANLRGHKDAAAVPKLGVFGVKHIEIDGVTIAFRIHEGRFNINAFVREMSEAKVRHAIGWLKPLPNTLRVRVVQARNLTISGTSEAIDAKVVVTCRDESAETHTVIHSRDPLWNSTFELNVEDPSTVIHVEVHDVGLSRTSMIGHWIMTTEWLAIDPSKCKYTPGTLLVNKQAHSMRGWFPLMDKKHQRADGGQLGELEMELTWFHTSYEDAGGSSGADGAAGSSAVKPALEQLQENSDETWLRLGDLRRVSVMLATFPYSLDIERVTLRNVNFFLADLFVGRKGLKELGGRNSGIAVDVIDMPRRLFKAGRGARGICVRSFLYRFFVKGIAPAVLGSGSILGGGIRELLYSAVMGSSDRWAWSFGHLKDTLASGISSKAVANALFNTHLKARLNFVRQGLLAYQTKRITGEDKDLMKTVVISGALMKTPDPPGTVLRRWKTVKASLQGNTLFYWITSKEDPMTIHGEGRKIKLDDLVIVQLADAEDAEAAAEADADGEIEMVLNTGKYRYWKAIQDNSGAHPSISDWIRAIRERGLVAASRALSTAEDAREDEITRQHLATFTARH